MLLQVHLSSDIKRGTIRLVIAGAALGIALVSSRANASTGDERTIADARTMHLAQSAGWLRLLHYRRTLWGGVASGVDGKHFFLSPQPYSLEAQISSYLYF